MDVADAADQGGGEVAVIERFVHLRSGFQQDINTVFPLALLQALVAAGEVGSLGTWHYSFMGASDLLTMKDTGAEVGRLLREDGVTAALLVPV